MQPLQPVNFVEPQDPVYTPEDIERKRKMAEMLRQQAEAPIRFQENAPISWTQGLAKMLQSYSANKKEKEADKETSYYRNKLAEAVRGGGDLNEMADRVGQYNPDLAMQLRLEAAKADARNQN